MAEEMEHQGGGGGGKVRALIEMATGSPAPEVDPRYLKSIKSIVRYSDDELRLAARNLMDLMKSKNAQVRFLSLLIIDELFMRSKLFRSLLVVNLDQLLSLGVGLRNRLPPPEAVAANLRSKAVEFLEKWNISFGVHYRQIRLGFDYLKNTLKYQFPNIQENAERVARERRERVMRSQEILMNKYEKLKRDFGLIKTEIQSTIDEIGECMDILLQEESIVPLEQLDDEGEEVDFRSSGLWQIRLEALMEGENFHENTDNKVVVDSLREAHKVLVTRHLVNVQDWTSLLIRVEEADNGCRDAMLKEFIDIRNRIISIQRKCEKSGCSLSDVNATHQEDEEIIWEEGETEAVNNMSSDVQVNKNRKVHDANKSKYKAPLCREVDKQIHDEGTSVDPVKKKLLAEAPVVKWGSSFHNWSSNQDVMANYKGLEVQSHWGRVDQDAFIPADRIAQLNYQATIYEEEPVEIQPCNAPLKKGGLCPRRDLKVCPFHGPIIPRDSEGKPSNVTLSNNEVPVLLTSPTEKLTTDSENDLVEQLAKQAIKNVRRRDEDGKMKEKAAKHARVLKVREHNKAVLRDAAMASTSSSAYTGDDLEIGSSENNTSAQRKKVPTKHRIADKLRSIRIRNEKVGRQKLKLPQC